MDIELRLRECKQRRLPLVSIMTLNFLEKTWSIRPSPDYATPLAWSGGLDAQFSRSGKFEVKDNGVLWIWDDWSGSRRNILIIRDAPTIEDDSSKTSGTVRIYDPPDRSYKDLEFPWARPGLVAAHTCGPDVTQKLIGTLKTVVADYNALGRKDAAEQWVMAFWWNIDVLRDDLFKITPKDCGCGGPCQGSVQVFGKCFRAGIVNYVLYGVIEGLTSTVIGDPLHTLYWFGKQVANTATGNLRAVGESTYVGYLESKFVNAGVAFVGDGVAGFQKEIMSIPGLPCGPCKSPLPRVAWKYTWAPNFLDKPSRF
jgi:hypothetical protein